MGIELDVLVGHPEYELLFMATQVARAAGLTYPSQSAKDFAKSRHAAGGFITLGSIQGQIVNFTTCPPCDSIGRKLKEGALMFSEPTLYKMLLRGHSEATEPFRKWVFEEVLPTIRKTGQYNAAESSDPIAVGIMGGDVAKPLTMAALPQRPQEDHKHDQLRPSPARGDHHRCTLRSQAWPGPAHQDHRQLILWLHRADHRLRSISPLRNGHP
ncbi:hypothetical protein H8F21_20915 [Pseudomonas sp. P66]|uniref:Bro-N domain-containing protein n=1 Tax=Pseudomonas arcuscaelestis TaxID=2710591 RepID=A0ABS2C2E3_9PSED|nr:hypothetical protein [Pseudomonas putida]MBA6110871.1 hypothetical protein [Pseudomonas asiatica]MBM5460031.1 hypothetical protein [Pseudomonas arcuscaelestis]